jgi:hypothetical protein
MSASRILLPSNMLTCGRSYACLRTVLGAGRHVRRHVFKLLSQQRYRARPAAITLACSSAESVRGVERVHLQERRRRRTHDRKASTASMILSKVCAAICKQTHSRARSVSSVPGEKMADEKHATRPCHQTRVQSGASDETTPNSPGKIGDALGGANHLSNWLCSSTRAAPDHAIACCC